MDNPSFPTGMPPEAAPPEPQIPIANKPAKSKKKLVIILILVTLVAAASAGAWLFLSNKKSQKPQANNSSANGSEQEEEKTSDTPETSATETLKSDFPRMELAYPNTWTATQNDNGVKLESPEFSYETLDGETAKGNFRLYIRQGAREADSAYIGRGVAVLASEKLAYKEPVTGQRPETNMSFFGLDAQDHFAFLFIAGNFSLQPGETLGPGYGKEPETFIVAGGYSSKELTEDLATNKVALDYFQTTNAYKQALEIIKSLKLL